VVRDKALTAARLRAAGIPAPQTWLTADPMTLAPLLDRTSLVIKPLRGLHGRGVQRVRNLPELEAVPRGEPLVAQEYVPGPGRDLKLYLVGDKVFAVRKPFSATSYVRDGESCRPPDAAREIALECGRALGLGLYGLDLVDGPVVVDVNYFPGYRGVPDPVQHIAGYVEAYARGRSAAARSVC
jgi:ribosomal protein S6--L-glutamate ligase